jgi:hypothetical protein
MRPRGGNRGAPVEEGQGRRLQPDLAATGATNLAALKDTAAISSATLCDEDAACEISSPPWLVPLLLCPASIDTPSYVL